MKKHLLMLALALAAWFGTSVVQAQTVYLLNENFDGITSGIPTGWDNSVGTTTVATYKWSSANNGYSGRCLRFNSYQNSNGNTNYLMTPTLDLSQGDWILTFRYKNPVCTKPFNIYISTDNGATYTTAIDTGLVRTDNRTHWTQKKYSLTSLAGNSSQVKIVFYGESDWGYGDDYIYIDDVTVESAPTCKAPTAMALTSLSPTTATMMWGLTDDGVVPGSYNLTVTDQAGTVVINNQSITAPQLNYQITGLTAGTTYNVQLISDCQAQYKGLSDPCTFTFTTTCVPASDRYVNNFDAETAMPACILAENASLSTTHHGATGKSLRLATAQADNAYLLFPELLLRANNVEMGFFARAEGGVARYMVGLVSDAGDVAGTFEPLLIDSLSTSDWTEIRLNTALSASTDSTAMMAIYFTSGENRTIYIDDVTIHAISTCTRPEDFAISNVTAFTADLAWTTTNATEAAIYIMSATDTTRVVATTNPYTVTGLNQNTDYTFYIRGLCSAADSSDLNPYPVQCRTLCSVADSAYITEGFETTQIPDCWSMGTVGVAGGSSSPFATGTTRHSGSRGIRFSRQAAGNHSYLATQQLPLTSADGYLLSLWVRRDDAAATPGEKLRFWVNSVDNDTVGATYLGAVSRHFGAAPMEAASGWYLYEFPIRRTGNLFVIIEGVAEDGGDLWFDDLAISALPTCPRPGAIEFDEPDTASIRMHWTANGTESEWAVAYRLANAMDSTLCDTTVTVSGNAELTISGLSHSTDYSLTGTVSAVCAAGDTSATSAFTRSFSTECLAVTTFPFVEGFEGLRFPPVCWSTGNLCGGTGDWVRDDDSRTVIGTGSAWVNDARIPSQPYLGSPELILAQGVTYEVRLAAWRTGRYSNKPAEGVHVYVGPNANDTLGAVHLGFIPQNIAVPPTEASAGMYYYSFQIPDSVIGAQHIILMYDNQWGTGMNIDDVMVREKPMCQIIADGCTVTGVTDESATVAITDGTVTDWQLSVVPSGAAADDSAAIRVVVSGRMDTVISGLRARTAYQVYVRRICDADTGEWSLQAAGFTTLCTPYTVPFLEDFESYTGVTVLGGCYQTSVSDRCLKVFQNKEGGGNNVFNHTPDGQYGVCTAYSAYEWNTMISDISAYADIRILIHLDAGRTYKASAFFKAYAGGGNGTYSNYRASFRVGTATSPINTVGGPFLISDDVFINEAAYFSVQSSGTYILEIHTENANEGGYYPYIDDISVTEVTCTPPAATVLTTLASTRAVITATSNADMWDVAVSANPIDLRYGVNGDVYSADSLTSNTFSLTGLTPNTDYYYTVRSHCDTTLSDWMSPQSFHTRCNIDTVPYAEDFEVAEIVNCWHQIGATGSISHTGTARTGNGAIKLDAVTAVMPEMAVTSFEPYMITGWARSEVDSTVLSVGLITDPEDIATYERIDSVLLPQANRWTEFFVYFDSFASDDYAFLRSARHIVLTAGDRVIRLDDIRVENPAACAKPVGAVVRNATAHTIDVDWTEQGQATQWLVRAQGPNTVIETVVSTHPYTLTGLNAVTNYNVSVAALCSATDTSEFALAGDISTACDYVNDTWFENFSSIADGNTPTCWDKTGSTARTTNDSYIWGVTTVDGNKVIRFYHFQVYPGIGLINTPEIILQPGNRYGFDFDLGQQSNVDEFSIKIRRSGDAAFTTLPGAQYVNTSGTYDRNSVLNWDHKSVDISAYAGDTVQLQFFAMSNYGQGAIFVDNVHIRQLPQCSVVDGVAISALAPDTAVATITDNDASHTAWQYALLTRGQNITDSGIVITPTTAKVFVLTNLVPETGYTLYARAQCDSAVFSAWSTTYFVTPEVPTCPDPQLTLGQVADNSVTFTITPRATGQSIMYALTDDGTWNAPIQQGMLLNATDTTIVLTGLDMSHSYQVLVQAVCSDVDFSNNVTLSFTTPCGTITDFPYTEDFESMPAYSQGFSAGHNEIVNLCWTVSTTSDEDYVQIQNNMAAHSGGKALVFFGQRSTNNDQITLGMPPMDSIASIKLGFYHRSSGYTSANETLEVGYLTAQGNFTSLANVAMTANFAHYEMELNEAPATAQRIGFRYKGGNYAYLDDITVTRIVVAPVFTDTICFSEGYVGHGFNLAQVQVAVGENTFTRTRQAVAANEFDTVYTLHLYKHADARSVLRDTICAGVPYANGTWVIDQPATGHYFHTYAGQSAAGCDTTIDLYLTVLPASHIIRDSICTGGSYVFGDTTLTTAGMYVRQYQSARGCSITDTLYLAVTMDSIFTTAEVCDYRLPYEWNGRNLTAAGIYTAQIQNAIGCTQTAVLTLTVLNTDSTINVRFCHGGQVHVVDTIISAPGTYTLERINAQGCEVTYHVNAVEDSIATGAVSDYVCQGRLYYGNGINGLAVTADTVVAVATLTDRMCDSTTLVTIHVEPTIYTEEYDTIMQGQAYEWNDQHYTAAGTYVDTLMSAVGCDSVATLHLEVIVGVDNVYNHAEMTVVPNPVAKGSSALVFISGITDVVRVEIINSFGAVISSSEPNSTPLSLRAPEVSGVYNVRILTARGEIYVEKLVVQ